VDPELNPAVKPVAIFFPSPFKRWPSLAFAAIVEVGARPDAEAIERIASRIDGNVERPDAESLISAAVNPLEALAFPLRRRKALLFLATAGSARLTEGVAVSGDDDVLARICARILERVRKDGRKAEGKEEGETEGEADGKGTGKGARNGGGPPEGKGTKAEIAWLLESSTLEVLSALVADGQTSPAVEGVLLNFAGQAGRQALSLEKALRGSRRMEDLERLLAEENLLSLEDSSPAARARALRWLEARGMAPKGYDPLAPPRERRAALEKAFAAEAKPQEGGKP
jgi:hypothetical protein